MTHVFLFSAVILSAGSPAPCDKATDVDPGTVVTCSGALLIPHDMAESLLLCRDIELPRCKTKLERERFIGTTKLDGCISERDSCDDALSKTDSLLEKAIDNHEQPAWYTDPWMNIAIGIAIGSALTASVM